MITIKSISVKNFLSVGNVAQGINFDRDDLTLVLGENLDLGGNDNRNGVGKSTILNALSYALYGSAITNIRKENLINKTNGKGMLVSIELDHNGTQIKIDRGRKPNVFKLVVNGKEVASDEDSDDARGESRETQKDIESLIGLTHQMFKQIVGLNTYNQPFLSLKSSEQRELIEQLLGITKLSEKADKLKELLRITKDDIKHEEFKLKAVSEANKQLENNVSILERKSVAWNTGHLQKIAQLEEGIKTLYNIDIEEEIDNQKKCIQISEIENKAQLLMKDLKHYERDKTRYLNEKSEIETKLKDIVEGKTCPLCKQSLHVDHSDMINDENRKLDVVLQKLKTVEENITSVTNQLSHYKTDERPAIFYTTLEEALNHRASLEQLASTLENELSLSNPYVDQIQSLKDSVVDVNYDSINALCQKRDHQEFLLKLLTSKDSFIRKKIIDQNMSYLNSRLEYYLIKMGLPHDVKFQSNLEVSITEHGRDLDFDNLSRGERTRLILSLSWAFRDVFESLNDKINLLFIDELIDNGLDSSGVESALSVLKHMSRDLKRSIFLISHREELIGRVDQVLTVVKEGGFTSFNTDDE